MNERVQKRAVRQSFDRAAVSYDSVAGLQRQVCDLLLAAISMRPAPTLATTILDAGCGTGYGQRLLAAQWPDARLVAADFAHGMLIGSTGERICADIEALPLPADTFDLYWSSLSIQWCNPQRVIAEAARVLAPRGVLAVSSLGTGTLAELHHAFAGVDQHRHVLEFSPEQLLAEACTAAGLRNLMLETRSIRRYHPDLKTLLRTLKSLGANQVGANRRPGLFGRQVWQEIEARYDSLREDAGLPATYQVILCTALK
ncbi:MAG: malonyl-ACP O-methyltransferase BioC [Gammaproteobacteria bacterium]|nr:malonyl-ACP O-methyltransferase BioC [Rhodocyclaceae bacterium]MBU3908721.1 malonyl-ACP O-methyltransferase BioC [Gammaproteobacteria bacterium]MBU3988843.1 malonyl-ACP O-methyltransferase BioC [Gammaproteobacteria bacterium]MBU4004749.1 malonyl-ACP O-methyltransferase BioC [Gammaproteobacteria bacterium]MBU4021352.1 malonyl-ACP O-methyltransferase BioC [Gammaproteobacteria bacterium]